MPFLQRGFPYSPRPNQLPHLHTFTAPGPLLSRHLPQFEITWLWRPVCVPTGGPERAETGVLFVVSSSESNTVPGTQQGLKYLLEKSVFGQFGTWAPGLTLGLQGKKGARPLARSYEAILWHLL